MAAEAWYTYPTNLPEGDEYLAELSPPSWAKSPRPRISVDESAPKELISLEDVREGVNKLIDEKVKADSLFSAYLEKSGIKGLVGRKIPAEEAQALREHYQQYTGWVRENPEWVTEQLKNRLKDAGFNAHKKEDAWLATARAAREGVTSENLRTVLDNVFAIDKVLAKPRINSSLYKGVTDNNHAKEAQARLRKPAQAPKEQIELEVRDVAQPPREKKAEARLIPVSAIHNQEGKVVLASADELLREADDTEAKRRAELAVQDTTVQEARKQDASKLVRILSNDKEPIDLASKRRDPALDMLVARVDGGHVELVRRDEDTPDDTQPDTPRSVSFFGRVVTGAATLAAVGGAVIIPTTEAAAMPAPNADTQPTATAPKDPTKTNAAPSESGATNAPYDTKKGSGVTTLPYDAASTPNIEPVGNSASAEPSASSSSSASAAQSETNSQSPQSSETASSTPPQEAGSSTAEPTDPEILRALDKAIAEDLAQGKISESQATDLLQKVLDANTALTQDTPKSGGSDVVTNVVKEYLDIKYGANSSDAQKDSSAAAKPAASTPAKSSETSTKAADTATTEELEANPTTVSAKEKVTPAAAQQTGAIKADPTFKLVHPLEVISAGQTSTNFVEQTLQAFQVNIDAMKAKLPHVDPSLMEGQDVIDNYSALTTEIAGYLKHPETIPTGIATPNLVGPVYGWDVTDLNKKISATLAVEAPHLNQKQRDYISSLMTQADGSSDWVERSMQDPSSAYASVAPAFKKAQEEAAKTATPSQHTAPSKAHEAAPAAGVTVEKITVNEEYQKTLVPIAAAHKINVNTLYAVLAYYNGNLSTAHTQPMHGAQGWFGITHAEWDSPINNPHQYPFSAHDDLTKSAEVAANMLHHLDAANVEAVGTPERFAERNQLHVVLEFVHGPAEVAKRLGTNYDGLTQHEKNMVQQAYTALQNTGAVALYNGAPGAAARSLPANPGAAGKIAINGGIATFVPNPHMHPEQKTPPIQPAPNFKDNMPTTLVPVQEHAAPSTHTQPAAPAEPNTAQTQHPQPTAEPQPAKPAAPAAKPAENKAAGPVSHPANAYNNIAALDAPIKGASPQMQQRLVSALQKPQSQGGAGLAPLASAYMLGNFLQEDSNLDPKTVGDNGKALGLAQEWPARREDMPTNDTITQATWLITTELPRHFGGDAQLKELQDPNTSAQRIKQIIKDWEQYGKAGARYELGATIASKLATPTTPASTPKADGAPAAPAPAAQPSVPAQPAAPAPSAPSTSAITVGPNSSTQPSAPAAQPSSAPAPAAAATPSAPTPPAAPAPIVVGPSAANSPAPADKPAIVAGPTTSAAPAVPQAPAPASPAAPQRETVNGKKEPAKVGAVKYVSQKDQSLANMRYGKSGQTIATSGCVPTAQGMIIATLKGGDPVSAVKQAAAFNERHGYRTPNDGTANAATPAIMKANGLKAQVIAHNSTEAVLNAVNNGAQVLVTATVSHDSPNVPGTSAGHAYVITSDGKGGIKVADPKNPSKSDYTIQQALTGATYAVAVTK
jgi:hypothetical protein